MPPPRKAAQAKAHSASGSNSRKKIRIWSRIIIPGISIDAEPDEPMKNLDEGMRHLVLHKINYVFGSELMEEDLPVTGDERCVVYEGHRLPDDYQSFSVGELFDQDHVIIHFEPLPERIVETRLESQQCQADLAQALLDSANSELAMTRTELELMKKEMTAQGLRLDIALGENVEKKAKQKATKPLASESDQLLATIEMMMKRRDEEWGTKFKGLKNELEQEKEEWRCGDERLEGLKTELKREKEELKGLKIELEQEKEELKGLKIKLAQEKEERRHGDEKLFKIIRPLRLCILLDKTRDRFVQDLQFNMWAELSRNRPVEDYVIYNLRNPYRPMEEAIRWCLQTNNLIREAGNKSAHEAEEQNVRDAVISVPEESEERKYLHSLFMYASYQGSPLLHF